MAHMSLHAKELIAICNNLVHGQVIVQGPEPEE